MEKNRLVPGIVIGFVLLLCVQVFAGGRERIPSSKGEVIGTPPEAMARASNISRHKGNGELFIPVIDFLSRVTGHYIHPGDKKPGPGWGVPEGHNIGNAPQPPVIGKVLDRSGRGKLEPVVDFLKRIEQEQAHNK